MIEKNYRLSTKSDSSEQYCHIFSFKVNYFAGTCSEQIKLMESWSLHHRSLVHMSWLLRIHDDVHRYRK